jgi:hypothetical protein
MNIKTVTDSLRGCGWRKPGGLYFIAGGLAAPCGKLPVEVTRCPCCDAGIKPARGWTWINPKPFFDPKSCGRATCGPCPLSKANLPDKAGLLWVGEKFYPTPLDFTAEAARLGVARRIAQIPNDFKTGETWILFGHRKAIPLPDLGPDFFNAGIFHAFKPTEIQYVVTGKETESELEALVKRGITPVIVKRDQEQKAMNL